MKIEIPYRHVSTFIWRDEKFRELPDDAQLVWFHLYTNPYTNGMGLYHASVEGLAADKKWPVNRYRKAMDIGILNLFFSYDERSQQVFFPKFFKWNLPQNPKHFQGMLSQWKSVSDSPLKNQLFNYLETLCEEWGMGYLKVLDTYRKGMPYVTGYVPDRLPIQEHNQEHNQEQEQEKELLSKSSFDLCELWKLLCPSMVQIKGMTHKRKNKIRLRLKEHPERGYWEEVFSKIERSSFCKGEGKTGWKATFDWIIDNEENGLKTLEGKYDGGSNVAQSGQNGHRNPTFREIDAENERRDWEQTKRLIFGGEAEQEPDDPDAYHAGILDLEP